MKTASLETSISCMCGKVQGVVKSPSALRMICHCNDDRNQYTALNQLSGNKLQPLDPCGGVDLTNIFHNEIKFDADSKKYLRVMKVSETGVPRVYAGCCFTPMYRSGKTVLLNTNIVPEDVRPPVAIRIMGREATGPHKLHKVQDSVGYGWGFSMIGRMWTGLGQKETAFDVTSVQQEIVPSPKPNA
ncbi:hypothetical protein BJ742DRAFT_733644 [Cladochytrium replicatum]|nr:hypothetical protein BJ742DRAFT_733644 [Cladochytrium replicatum]